MSRDPTFYWPFPEWLGDQGVWNAAADEVQAKLGHVNVSAHENRSWGVFTYLPKLRLDPKCPFFKRRNVESRSSQAELDLLARMSPWHPPLAEIVQKRNIWLARQNNYVPQHHWQETGRGLLCHVPSYSWAFITALLDELRLPECLFAMRTPSVYK